MANMCPKTCWQYTWPYTGQQKSGRGWPKMTEVMLRTPQQQLWGSEEPLQL